MAIGQRSRAMQYLFLVPLAGIFAPALVRGDIFLFRDAAHYYLPLYEFVQQQWADGHLPLWNPYEQLGRPLLADPTAAVAYPGRIIFLLPLGFARCLVLFVFLHYLLAGCGVLAVLRRRGATAAAGALAALSYTLCGHLLVQHANLPYLISAAWMPWGIAAVDALFTRPTLRALAATAAVWSLVVLGGDLQGAFHLGLLALGYLYFLRSTPLPGDPGGGGTMRRARWLAAASAATLILSAVQIVPAALYGRYTDRLDRRSPQSLIGWLVSASEGDLAGPDGRQPLNRPALPWRRPPADSHAARIYDFSIAPARFVELLLPDGGGRPYPVDRRWMERITGPSRDWSPSLYMGIIPVLLATCQFTLRGGGPWVRWISASLLAAGLASLGGYGPVWLLRQVAAWLGLELEAASHLQPGAGGLYWWLVLLLPGYSLFRYPAKWWSIVALMLALLAGLGLDQLRRNGPQLRRRAVVAMALSGALAASVVLLRPQWVHWLGSVPADRVFGPLDVSGALHGLLVGSAQALVISSMVATAWLWVPRAPRPATGRRVMMAVCVVVTAVDLALAGAGIVQVGPASLVRRTGPLSAWPASSPANLSEGISRYYRPPARQWRPERWSQSSDPLRLQQVVAWDSTTLYPKYGLLVGDRPWSSVLPIGSAQDRQALAYLGLESLDRLPSADRLVRIGCRYWIMPQQWRPTEGPSGRWALVAAVPQGRVWQDRQAQSLAWIVRPTASQLFPDERVELIEYSARQIRLRAALADWRRVVLSVRYLPGWHASIRTSGGPWRPVSVTPVDNVLASLRLPKGVYEIRLRYRPVSARFALAVSALGWVACLWCGLASERAISGVRHVLRERLLRRIRP